MTGRWPWPGDTPLDRARRVALSYREALYQHAPEAAKNLDVQTVGWGEIWVAPQLSTIELDDYITVDVAAQHVGLTAKAVYAWIYKGTIEAKKGRDNRLRVKLDDVLEVSRELRRKRAGRHAGAA